MYYHDVNILIILMTLMIHAILNEHCEKQCIVENCKKWLKPVMYVWIMY